VVGLNRELLQRQADREKRLQRLEEKLELVNRRRKWETRISILLLIVLVVFIYIFAARVTPVRVDGGTSTQPPEVSFTRSHVEWLQEKYNYSEENGFCLFGHIQRDEVVVEQVEYVDNPVRQSHQAMSFTCIPQILARWKPLVTQEEYKLVGAIHTHPYSKDLSDRDWRSFQLVDPFVGMFGVYNKREDSMRIYTEPGQKQPLTNVLRIE
jgi:proteasome lid subunit RPN8/RPN11